MKHKWILWVTCFALILCMCTACSSGGVAEQAQTAEHTLTGHMDLQYAQEFTVDYYSDGTAYILIHGEIPFLLVPEGVTVSDEVIGDAVVIQQPLNSIYQASSAMVDPFLQIGALDKIRMTSTDENNWAIPEVLDALAVGREQHVASVRGDEGLEVRRAVRQRLRDASVGRRAPDAPVPLEREERSIRGERRGGREEHLRPVPLGFAARACGESRGRDARGGGKFPELQSF